MKTSSQPQPQQAQVPSTSTVKSKKGAQDPRPSNSSSTMTTPSNQQSQEPTKKVSRRSSKPFINWFQRKLAGTVRARRVSESQRYGASSPRGKSDKQHRRSSVPMPPPPLSVHSRTRSHGTRAHSLRGTISLNESNDDADTRSYRSDSDDGLRSSVARESLYSPASYLEADEDASVRPLPPSSPPSPVPSRDSSSYLSHSRTFRSMTASTKPTTLLSVDLTGGMAHIAQAPPTPTTPGHRMPPHIRTHSTGPSAGSITFSAFPLSSPTNASRPSSGNSVSAGGSRGATLTAPLYTSHHPRNNPRPSSPPPDDASVLTLASSAFGMPGARIGVSALALSGRGSIADDSVSHWSHTAALTDSTSMFMMMGDVEEGMEERYADHDVDASVRALRPRSSRRGSWDSAVSGWSANVGPGSAAAPSPIGVRNKWGAGSFRTGGLSMEDALEDGEHYDEDAKDAGEEKDDNETEEGVGTKKANEIPAPTEGAPLSVETVDSPPFNKDADAPTSFTPTIDASTVSLPGSKAEVPAAIASTVTLPGSKTGSEIPSLEDSEQRSGASTPTKTELPAVPAEAPPAELNAAVAAMNLEDRPSAKEEAESGQEVEVTGPTPLSPTDTTHTEYLSAPSTPAAI